MKRLEISGCGVEVFPEEISQLQKLKAILIDGNPLGKIPNWIFDFVELVELSCADIGLKTVPEKIDTLSALKILDLSSNQLTQLPTEIGNLLGLSELKIQFNEFINIPTELAALPLKQLMVNEDSKHLLPKDMRAEVNIRYL